LADAINLGLTKMAESCPGTTYAKLSWLQAWHVRDETYSAALAELVNAQFRQPFAENARINAEPTNPLAPVIRTVFTAPAPSRSGARSP